MTSDGNLYLLQYGSYINQEVMKENIKKLDNYLVYEEDNKYYVYIGAYTLLENALEMQKIFENQGLWTYLKSDYYGNSDVLDKIATLERNILESDNAGYKQNITKEILDILKKNLKVGIS